MTSLCSCKFFFAIHLLIWQLWILGVGRFTWNIWNFYDNLIFCIFIRYVSESTQAQKCGLYLSRHRYHSWQSYCKKKIILNVFRKCSEFLKERNTGCNEVRNELFNIRTRKSVAQNLLCVLRDTYAWKWRVTFYITEGCTRAFSLIHRLWKNVDKFIFCKPGQEIYQKYSRIFINIVKQINYVRFLVVIW